MKTATRAQVPGTHLWRDIIVATVAMTVVLFGLRQPWITDLGSRQLAYRVGYSLVMVVLFLAMVLGRRRAMPTVPAERRRPCRLLDLGVVMLLLGGEITQVPVMSDGFATRDVALVVVNVILGIAYLLFGLRLLRARAEPCSRVTRVTCRDRPRGYRSRYFAGRRSMKLSIDSCPSWVWLEAAITSVAKS